MRYARKAWEIVGWTYEADVHCDECTARRFGEARLDCGALELKDSEGNRVHPIFASDESPEDGEYCADCGAVVSEPWPNA